MPGWSNILAKRNSYPIRFHAFLTKFGWDGNNFMFAGIPINLNGLTSQAKSNLYYLVALCLISRAQASNDDMYFTDPSGNTTYKYIIDSDTLNQYAATYTLDNLKQVPKNCGALMLSTIDAVYKLIHTSTAYVTTGTGLSQSTKSVDSASLYRISNGTVESLFETCMINGMDDADELHISSKDQWIAAGILLGTLFGCIVMGLIICKFCCNGEKAEKQPLLPTKKGQVDTFELPNLKK